MPKISEFFGIRIFMYWNDHNPPHFHAEYNDLKALISIQDGVVIEGMLPNRQLKLVLAWCEIHKSELMENWLIAEQHGDIHKIKPLQ